MKAAIRAGWIVNSVELLGWAGMDNREWVGLVYGWMRKKRHWKIVLSIGNFTILFAYTLLHTISCEELRIGLNSIMFITHSLRYFMFIFYIFYVEGYKEWLWYVCNAKKIQFFFRWSKILKLFWGQMVFLWVFVSFYEKDFCA